MHESIGKIIGPNCISFPSRKSEERWPNKDRINDLSCHVEQSSTRIEGYDSDKKRKPLLQNNGVLLIYSQ